ncbi:tripartite motif-containing protein 65 isoform X2 [Denticeps clupeoides]|nr:tripartite motif-containing protein 65 isoform X2 [Denticeps clupeoides]
MARSPEQRDSTLASGDDRCCPDVLCQHHQKPLAIYCKTEGICVCCECSISRCKGHELLMVETERKNREEALNKKTVEIAKYKEDTEKSMAELTENIASAKVSVQQTSQWITTRFSQLTKTILEKQESMQCFIDLEHQAVLEQADQHLNTLQERLMQLQHTKEQIEGLQMLSDSQMIQESRLIEVPQIKEVPTEVSVTLHKKLTQVTEVLSQITKLVHEDLEKAVDAAVGQDKQGSPQDKRPVLAVVPSPATPSYSAGKEGLSAHYCSLTFDPCTANSHLLLSQNNCKAEHLSTGQQAVPTHDARFDNTWQVLCSEGFKQGCHYWEMVVSKPWAYLGVAYLGIPRKEKGKRCVVGMNEVSWSLQLDERELSAWHSGRRETVSAQQPQPDKPLRIGMLLDYDGGTLTFYGEGQVRLHAFYCAFAQELYPACWIGEGVSVTLCPL